MTDDKIIKNAQYRKGLSIAFFNATNSAIALVVARSKEVSLKTLVKDTIEIRDIFLEEHKQYYINVIAHVGGNYDTGKTIKKLETASTGEELRDIWKSLSEDERHDSNIIKVVKELKTKFIKKDE